MTLSPSHTRWIALIRYQADTAVEQSKQPVPLAMLAINGMHDAVEALLGLVVEHHKRTLKGKDFPQLFDAVASAVPAVTHYRTAMIALNSARVGYKHHGNVLDSMSIERHRTSAQNFLTDLAREGLGEDFDTVGLMTLIANEAARRHVEAAEMALAAGDGMLAMGRLRMAFNRLVEDYTRRKTWSPGSSLFDTRPWSPPSRGGDYDLAKDSNIVHINKWLGSLDERLRLLMLGVDVRRYLYLDAHAPGVAEYFGGDTHLTERRGAPAPSEDIFTRCRQFVVDTALQLGADDYEFDAWSARRTEFDSSGTPVAASWEVRVIPNEG